MDNFMKDCNVCDNKIKNTWLKNYKLAKQYYENYGNLDIHRDYVVDGFHLGMWIAHQRNDYNETINPKKARKKPKLNKQQINLLNEIGMIWNKNDKSWDDIYDFLSEYYFENGNFNVPITLEINGINVRDWIYTQRLGYFNKNNCVMTKDHAMLLNDLDFDWAPQKTRILNLNITQRNKNDYYQILEDRVNYIIDDLVYEGINEIDSSNQDSIEKIMIKRIWR